MKRLSFLAFTITAAFGAVGAPAAPASPKATQGQDLRQIQEEVKRLEGNLRSGKEAEASLSSELGRMEKLMKLQSLEIKLSAMELEKSEGHVQEMTMRKDSLQQSIENRKHRLRQLLSLLPTLETRSPIARLTNNDAVFLDQYRNLVNRLLISDRKEIIALRKVLDEVESLNGKLSEDKERLLAHNEDLKEKQAVLELNQKMKKELLAKARTDQVTRMRAYQSAKAAEGELESVLNKFNVASDLKRQQEEKSVASADPAPKKVGGGFLAHKGGIPLPADGKIVSAFGRKYDAKTSLYTFHKGIDIDAGAGSAVKAIFPGKVVYAGQIGGYGQLLILDHGDQYFSLVGQLGEALKKEGDEVKEGETIARSAADNTPVYFEIRQRHIAVNPLPWFPEALRVSAVRLPE
jgi:septal ring factor EnvC (AmiA/AmiB activator)